MQESQSQASEVVANPISPGKGRQYTADKKNEFFRLVKDGPVLAACTQLNISRSVAYAWIAKKRDEDARKKAERAAKRAVKSAAPATKSGKKPAVKEAPKKTKVAAAPAPKKTRNHLKKVALNNVYIATSRLNEAFRSDAVTINMLHSALKPLTRAIELMA